MNIVHVGVGPVCQSDVDLAQACGACIVGFNVKNPASSITMAATQASIKVLTSHCTQSLSSGSVNTNAYIHLF